MSYRFVTEKLDYSAYASGQFFYNASNQPAFPVRLSSEIFQRCVAVLEENGRFPPYTLYDPTVGSGYHLATLAYLHWSQIKHIIGSDIDTAVLETTHKNFSLVTPHGVQTRIAELETLIDQFGKFSHRNNLQIAQTFEDQLQNNLKTHAIKTSLFQANALADVPPLAAQLGNLDIDIVFADVPYEQKTQWQAGDGAKGRELWQLLDTLLPFLTHNTVVAIAVNKKQSCAHEKYQRVGRFQVGKRRVFLLRPT